MRDNIKKAIEYIINHADEPIALSHIAALAELSQYHFQKVFKAEIGLSPKEFQKMIRKKILKSELRDCNNVLDAIFAAGFGSTSRVYGQANDIGINLSTYKAKGLGEIIHYKTALTNKFKILMAASSKGVCAVEIGEDEADLLNRARLEFPQASLVETTQSDDLSNWLQALCDYVDNLRPLETIPLDIRGTIFQEKIWRFLTSIKEGQTISYGEIAKQINMPKSARAIANAVGANKIAILIPCHRVLRGDNGLGGYKWGIENKKSLLDAKL